MIRDRERENKAYNEIGKDEIVLSNHNPMYFTYPGHLHEPVWWDLLIASVMRTEKVVIVVSYRTVATPR